MAITPSDGVVVGFTVRDLALSPDGTRIVYQSPGPPFRLAVRALDQLAAVPLDATVGTSSINPFISSDSAWVGFFSENDKSLKKVSIRGGPAVDICNVGAPLLRGARLCMMSSSTFWPIVRTPRGCRPFVYPRRNSLASTPSWKRIDEVR